MTDRLRNMSHENWDYFGDPRVGIPSEDIPEGSIMYSRAQADQSALHRVVILSVSRINVLFGEDGTTQSAGVTGTAQYYKNGIALEIFAFTISVSVTASGPTDGSLAAAVQKLVTPILRGFSSSI